MILLYSFFFTRCFIFYLVGCICAALLKSKVPFLFANYNYDLMFEDIYEKQNYNKKMIEHFENKTKKNYDMALTEVFLLF